ncbi:hypothetical protein DT075_21855 [Bacillus licheniformis]|nr:hypothetical protein DT075_21855 [Bacillus licheniformis]
MDTQPEREQAVKRAQRTGIKLFLTLPILSWALYDFANTIFSSNIVTIFFPFYLQEAVAGRFLAKSFLSPILMIGYIMAFFTERRQALHDMLAGTIVVKK